MSEYPSLAEGLARILDSQISELHTALPGEVRSFDGARQTATVRPMVRRVRFEGGTDNGERVVEDYPDLADVPVLFPVGGGVSITWKLDAGSTGLLVVCSDDPGGFYRTGDRAAPELLRRLGWAGAVFLPFGAKIGSLSVPTATGTVQVTCDRMEVGGNTDAAALASRVQTLEDNFLLHVHLAAGSPTGTPIDPGPPQTPILPVDAVNGFGSAKLKVGG